MAYKKNKKKSNSYKGKKTYSAAEKKSYKRGFLAGLFSAKKKTKSSSKYNKKSKQKKHTRTLMQDIKYYRDHNLGVLYRDGKYYDTNFIDEPTELDKSFVKKLHSEYDVDNKRSDREVADMFVRHMRRKYGVFDRDGNFLHMLGEEK